MPFQLTVLDTGRLFMGNPKQIDPPGPRAMAPALAFLVRGAAGNVLVDTGMPHTAHAVTRKPFCEQPVGWDVVTRLAGAGLEPSGLTAVIFTHLHWDHAAYARSFPGVPKYLQRSEAEHASVLPENLKPFYDTAPDILADPNLCLVAGEYEILPGIKLIPAPGHTPGHQAVAVSTHRGEVILAGDAAWRWGSGGLEPPRRVMDREAADRTFTHLAARGLPILASHDRTATEWNHGNGEPAKDERALAPTHGRTQGASKA